MQSVGSKLREAREKKGFSLDEINARTRINSRNLIAIEGDEVKDISSPFFYRSFVRQYAETVDLDFQILAPAVEMIAGNMRQPELPGQGEFLPARVMPVQRRPKSDAKWVVPAALLFLAVAIGSGLFAAWKYYRPLVHAATLPPAAPENTLTQQSAGQKAPEKSTETSAVTTSVLRPVASMSAPAIANNIHLELAATERTWLSVTADGKPAYQGILEPAETKVLDGLDNAKLKTGNAGGVVITFNGKEIGPIGPRGQTRTVVFTKAGFEVQKSGNSALISAAHIGG